MTRKKNLKGFTLIELLVIITIIGVLLALLLPAVQTAREAARRVQCQSHVKQLATAAIAHEEAIGHFPTGGWFYTWPGDADRGFDRDQPGGWAYNVLPFLEESSLHDLPADGLPDVITQEWLDRALDLTAQAIPVMYCPSRRAAIPYASSGAPVEAPRPVSPPDLPSTHTTAFFPELHGKLDYAINGGEADSGRFETSIPQTIAEAEAFAWCTDVLGNRTCNVGAYNTHYRSVLTAVVGEMSGVSFRRSEVSLRHVTDGASGTYLIGEKCIPPSRPIGDGSWCIGFSNDNTRWGRNLPLLDASVSPREASEASIGFGSSHPSGFHMAYCDGSVRVVAYEIDPLVHLANSSRHDGVVPGSAGWHRTQQNNPDP